MRFIEKNKGAISIFLVLILVPMMTVSALFVDAGKVYLGRSVAESAGDLVLNSALADYDTKLKDLYGLFATAQNTEEFYKILEDYYKQSIISAGLSSSDAQTYTEMLMDQLGAVEASSDISDYLNIELTDFSLTKTSNLSLANAAVLEKQIVDFMKYRGPINTGLSFVSALQSFTSLSEQTDLVDKRTEYYKAESETMNNAYEAWKQISQYNAIGFSKEPQNYFPGMDTSFASFDERYTNVAKQIIRNLYDTQDYASFTAFFYSVGSEMMNLNGRKRQIPVLYTNKDKTSMAVTPEEYLEYTNDVPDESEITDLIQRYYDSHDAYEDAAAALREMVPVDGTYGLQFLVQLNRAGLYEAFINTFYDLYMRYAELRAKVFALEDDDDEVMSHKEKLHGSSSERTLGYYYNEICGNFDALSPIFEDINDEYTGILQSYSDRFSSRADLAAPRLQIDELCGEFMKYRAAIADSVAYLTGASSFLEKVYNNVKDGGTLDQKAGSWENSARNDKIKDSSMSKQDLAEIDSLSTYLNPEDVEKLMNKIDALIPYFQKLLNQIDSYEFFGEPLSEYSNYDSFHIILTDKIGKTALYSVPTIEAELNRQINEWVDGQYSIGEKIEVSWTMDSRTSTDLSTYNFYAYMYAHFTGSALGGTVEKNRDGVAAEQNNENGKGLYDNIKAAGAEEAKKQAENSNNESSEKTISGDDLPSKLKYGTRSAGGSTPSGNIETGDDAAKNTSASLSSMFNGLGEMLENTAETLRDDLYLTDYAVSMFSYDTIENEYKEKNPSADEVKLTTLTDEPIDAAHNYAYRSEVEYIIYGGEKPSSAVTKVYASIYGVRLAFDLIYAFSCSEVRETALAIATPISAATLGVLPVPLIQAAIIVAVSCIRAGMDLADLNMGKEVPLFHNKETWELSPSSLVDMATDKAKELVMDVASGAVNSGVDELTKLLDMTDDEITDYIKTGTDELEDLVSTTYNDVITRQAETAIQKLTTLANNALEEYMLNPAVNMHDYVSDGLDAWISEEEANSNTDDISLIAKKKAVEIIKDQFIDEILDAIVQTKSNVQEAIDNGGQLILDKIRSVETKIMTAITTGEGEIIEYKNKMFSEIKKSLNGGAGELKATLNNQISGMFGESSTSMASTDNSVVASFMTFRYSDYLKLFILIGLLTNEAGIVLRIADLIQVNMEMEDENFALTNSGAYVRVDASVMIKPTLLALPLFAKTDKNPYSNARWYTVKYSDIRGY